MLLCCGLCPPPSSTEVMEVIAQTTLDLKAAVVREMADLCGRSGIVDSVTIKKDYHNKIQNLILDVLNSERKLFWYCFIIVDSVIYREDF